TQKATHWWFPVHKRCEAVRGDTRAKSEDRDIIVLDIDELSATGHSREIISGSPGAETALLGGAAFLALWYGLRTSIEEIIDSNKLLKELSRERQHLGHALREAQHAELS